MSKVPHLHFLAFLAALILVGAGARLWLPLEEAAVLGFDVATLLFVGIALPAWASEDADRFRLRAAREDAGVVLLVVTAAVVIAAILIALVSLIRERQKLDAFDFAIVAGTLVLAWVLSNLVYAYHYANLYFREADRIGRPPIVFPDPEPPVFSDFVYFSFVIGMTCQTADLDIASRRIRKVVTLQGLYAFFFNLGILALTINVLAGVL